MTLDWSYHPTTTNGTDPRCRHCGRPVIGQAVWGAEGPYHPECTRPPQPEPRPLDLSLLDQMIEQCDAPTLVYAACGACGHPFWRDGQTPCPSCGQ